MFLPSRIIENGAAPVATFSCRHFISAGSSASAALVLRLCLQPSGQKFLFFQQQHSRHFPMARGFLAGKNHGPGFFQSMYLWTPRLNPAIVEPGLEPGRGTQRFGFDSPLPDLCAAEKSGAEFFLIAMLSPIFVHTGHYYVTFIIGVLLGTI